MTSCWNLGSERLKAFVAKQLDKRGFGLTLRRMRGRIAAACAAMLVGLSPAGALPFARLAVAACASQESGALELAPTKIEPARELRARSFAARSHNDAPRAVVFRSPSGPAPSQAPPLA
jgi:hypothetical protein